LIRAGTTTTVTEPTITSSVGKATRQAQATPQLEEREDPVSPLTHALSPIE